MTEPRDAAALALHQWGLEEARLEQVSHSENMVFQVDADDARRYVLRLHRPGYHSLQRLISEQTWTGALTEAGLDVPIPCPTLDGKPFGRITVQGEARFVSLLEWVDGETMRSLMAGSGKRADAEYHFNQIGSLLARLHNQASRWQAPENFERHALDAEGLMGSTPFWGPFWQAQALSPAQQRHFSDLRRRIHGILRALPTDPDHFSMIHADLHPGNVVVNGDRLHLIDFDDAAYGWHAYDLAIALKDYQDDPGFDTYQAALVDGYRQHRSVEDDVLRLIPLFLLARALISIGWADARPELGHPEYVPQLAGYVEAHAQRVLTPYD